MSRFPSSLLAVLGAGVRRIEDRIADSLPRAWPYGVLLAVSLVVFGWFDGPNLKSFWDVTAPYDPGYALQIGLQGWYPFLNYGTPNFVQNGLPILLLYDSLSFLAAGSNIASEQIAWWALFVYGEFTAFALFRFYFGAGRWGTLGAFVGTAVFSFNPYTAYTSWGDSAPYSPLALGTLPLVILLIERYFRAESSYVRFEYAIAVALISPLLFVFFPLVIPIVLILGAIVLYHVSELRRAGTLLAVAVPLGVVINAFWWVPDFVLNSVSLLPINSPGNGSTTAAGVVFFSLLTPSSLSVRLLGENSLNAGWWTFSGMYTSNIGLFVVLLTVIPALAFLGACWPDGASKGRRALYLGIAMVGAVFATGAYPGSPTSGFYLWMIQTIPASRTLNYPAVSWIPLIVLGYSFLTGSLVAGLARRDFVWPQDLASDVRHKPRRGSWWEGRYVGGKEASVVVAITVIAVTAASGFPLITGQVSNNTYGSNFSLPPYVNELSDFLNSRAQEYRTLLLPPSINGLYSFNWGSGFLAYDPLDSLTRVSLIANYNPGQNLQDALYEIPGTGIGKVSFNSSSVGESDYSLLLAANSVKYIVVRQDWKNVPLYAVNFSAPLTIAFLDSNPNITYVESFGPDLVFEVSNPAPILVSHSVALPSLLLSDNLLSSYVRSVVSFSSPFKYARGSVTVRDNALTLSGVLNASVPWAIFGNQIPLGLQLVGSPALVVVSTGSPIQVTPILNDGTTNHVVGYSENLEIQALNVTFIPVPALPNVHQLLFTSVNSTIQISGIFVMYNLSATENLANLSSILPHSIAEIDGGKLPAIVQTNLSEVAEQAVDSTRSNNFSRVSGFEASLLWNISDSYISSDLAFSGSSPSNLTISNGTIDLTIENSEPFDLLINQRPMSLSIPSAQFISMVVSEPVGVLVYNGSNATNPSFTGHEILSLPSGQLLEVVELPPRLAHLTFLGVQTQPYNSVELYAMSLLNVTSAGSVPAANVTASGFLVATVSNLSLSPTKISANILFPETGQYLLSLTQLSGPAWRVSFSSCDGVSSDNITTTEIPYLDSLIAYRVSINGSGDCLVTFTFEPQTQIGMSEAVSAVASIALVAGLLYLAIRRQRVRWSSR